MPTGVTALDRITAFLDHRHRDHAHWVEPADGVSATVFFFTRSGTTWTQQAYVKGSNTEAFDEFGGSMALSRGGRTLVVGAHGEDSAARGVNGNQADNSADEAGAAYVFTYN